MISYNLYWLVVILGFLSMVYHERNGYRPFMKAKTPRAEGEHKDGNSNIGISVMSVAEKGTTGDQRVRE